MPFAFLAAAGGLAAWYFGRSSAPKENPLGAALAKIENGAGGGASGESLSSLFNTWLRAGSSTASNPVQGAATTPAANYANAGQVIGITAGPALAAAPAVKNYQPLPAGATLAQAMAMPELQASPAALSSFKALSLLGGNVADNYAAAMKAAP